MHKANIFKLLPFLALPGLAIAEETTSAPMVIQSVAESANTPKTVVIQSLDTATPVVPAATAVQTVDSNSTAPQIQNTVDGILPQLSLSEQQARAEAAEKARIQAEQDNQRLVDAENRIRQEVGNYPLQLPKSVAKVYLDNDFDAMWQSKTAERQFLKEYAIFAASGVSAKAANNLKQILASQDARAKDILLTDSLLDFVYYNENLARSANQWLYQLGSYKAKDPSDAALQRWVNAVKSQKTDSFVGKLVPHNHIYQQTVEKIWAMNGQSSGEKGASGSRLKQTLKPNATSAEVAVLAQLLLDKGLISELPQSNQYSGELVDAVKRLQASNNLKANGVVNKATRALLNPVSASSGGVSVEKLALNAQRLRIIPSFENGIFVNIPSYQLYYFRDGKLALQSKVIVGRDDRKTPVMYSKLSNVVVNPPWNVPPTILNKDIVPKLARNPGYANSRGFEILDGKGNKVDPYSVNWSAYIDKKLPYRIRQKAGDDSALGRYKFNMPSSDAIYLHDTPSRNLFNKTDRALSSGCVRVAKADELATILLKEAGWSEDRKQRVLASKKTTSANIQSNNPVYLYYVTAWVEGGRVQTLPDIYRLDGQIKRTNLDWAALKNAVMR